MFPKLRLINYRFNWKKDPQLKNRCDNNNWFLFSKKITNNFYCSNNSCKTSAQ